MTPTYATPPFPDRCAWRGWAAATALALALAGAAQDAAAQELEPRSYSASPVGANFAVVGYGNSSGEVLFDAGSPITDAKADIDLGTVGYSRVFGLAGHQSSLTVAVPYMWGDASGNVGEVGRSVHRSGIGDARVKFSALLIGGPALSPREFAMRKPSPIVGVSLLAVVPTGEYYGDKLINIGTNRWAVKPEIGVSYPMGRWQADAYAGVWFFTDNKNFLGQDQSRRPMGTFQAHLSYTIRPGLWAAVDGTYYTGGATEIGGRRSSRQEAARIGASLSFPVAERQSILLTYNRGAMTRMGNNFTTVGVAWRLLWF